MKTFYIVASVFFTVLILVLSFGNVGAQCSQVVFLFYPVRENITIVTLAIAVIGVVTGAFYHALFRRITDVADEDEEF